MSHQRGITIGLKLALLAGVPVIGALVLAGLIVRDARQEAERAAALGSVEDLAILAAQIGDAVHRLQDERAISSLELGKPLTARTKAAEEASDKALLALQEFLAARDVKQLPPRLSRDLVAAKAVLARLPMQRAAARAETADLQTQLDFFSGANRSLMNAIAALMQLSDDGELLRAISSLVSVIEFNETASQEHAVLANVFARSEFAPGVFKSLVTLVTAQDSSEQVFRSSATDDTQASFDSALTEDLAAKTAVMRAIALETMDDSFGVDANDWFALQGRKIASLRKVENALAGRVKRVAADKIAATRQHLTTSFTLAGGVLVVSVFLAWLIARGVNRSVLSLAVAAASVREHKDFGVRARRVSSDELGNLTDTFNEMLAGIQARDAELEGHRQNLEGLVATRTAELSARNDAMRIVLDNVEQGLATIHFDGSLSTETSAAFARWFGHPVAHETIDAHMARVDPDLGLRFKLGWESITDDFLPWELSLEQMPRKLQVRGRHYAVDYRGILQGKELKGALVVATDVTDALEQAKLAAAQQEALQVFERIMVDRVGFTEFLQEADRVMEQMRGPSTSSVPEVLRAVHTIKGNCAIFGIQSVAAVAHEIESFIAQTQSLPSSDDLALLHTTWQGFRARVDVLLGDNRKVIELNAEEILAIVSEAERRAPHEQIARGLRHLTYEPVQRRFLRMADRVQALAHKIGKAELMVDLDAENVRLPAERWAPFWSAFVHVVRNAVDHGIETPEERRQSNKSQVATIKFRCRIQADACVIEVSDDGRGIDWDRVAQRAQERGLPHAKREELVAALFSDGLSTRDSVDELSGRGVGMSAVLEATQALGGRVEVESVLGQGTTIRFRVPLTNVTMRPSAAA